MSFLSDSLRRVPPKHGLVLFLGLGISFLMTVPVRAQAKKSKATSEVKKLRGIQTGWPISATYFNSTQGKESPVVIMLHDKGGNQKIWESTAKTLQGKGYAVVTVDLRKHGQSKLETETKNADVKPVDYKYMMEDLETVKRFLMEEHQKKALNIRKTAIVAMGMSVPLAVNYALLDWMKKPYPDAPSMAARTPKGQDIRAMMFISPQSSLPGVSSTKPLRTLKAPAFNIAMLFFYGELDKQVKKDAEKMYKLVASNPEAEKRMHKVPRNTKANGTQLLSTKGRKDVENVISKFLDDHLKELSDPWRDRKSRLGN